MAAEPTYSWGDLPNELADLILAESIKEDCVTAVVIPFVCREWREMVSYHNHQRPHPQRVGAEAAKAGNLRVLQWLKEMRCPMVWVCYGAASAGRLDVLKWARENDCPWDHKTCAQAAKGGHLDLLKWARKKGCPWGTDTYTLAVEEGHVDLLKWVKENGCPQPCAASEMAQVKQHASRRALAIR